MIGHQWLVVLIGIAVALLLTWLLLIAALAIRRPKGKMLQLEAAYRQFSSTGAVPGPNQKLRLKLLVLAVLVIVVFGSRAHPPQHTHRSRRSHSNSPKTHATRHW